MDPSAPIAEWVGLRNILVHPYVRVDHGRSHGTA